MRNSSRTARRVHGIAPVASVSHQFDGDRFMILTRLVEYYRRLQDEGRADAIASTPVQDEAVGQCLVTGGPLQSPLCMN
jgi:hypothetical protein